MPRLFEENNEWNDTSSKVVSNLEKQIEPIYLDLLKQGFDRAEAVYAIHSATTFIELFHAPIRGASKGKK